MTNHRNKSKAPRYLVCTALAAAIATGGLYAGSVPVMGSSEAVAAKSNHKKVDKAVSNEERAVERNPQDAGARLELAHSYLQAGRFESAVTTFEDARQLGEEDARTALALALAQIGSGDSDSALTVLDKWRDSIPATDYGLAVALAGDTARGVSILADALRSGDDSAKLRQNLAYAYALDGRWSEARLMAAQDVPADQIDARISEWAQQGRPEDYRTRVAGLIGAPVRSDGGQPQHLALAPAQPQQPAASVALASEPETIPVQAGSNDGENLPPLGNGESFWVAEATRPEEPEAVAAGEEFDDAFADNETEERFVSTPIIQEVALSEPAQAPAAKAAPVRKPAPKASNNFRSAKGTHLVQLGSFSSQESAERAIKIYAERHPELSEDDMVISEAIVRGKKYWRVAAGNFNRRSATNMCSTVKSRGGGCIAYAASHPLPGAIDTGRQFASR